MLGDNEFSVRRWFALAAALLMFISGLHIVSNRHTAAQILDVWGQAPNDPAGTRSTLTLQVNYAKDWVAGETDPGQMVSITLTDKLGTPKSEAQVTADSAGDFFTDCGDWFSGWCPDIVPSDELSVTSGVESGEISPIGAILIDNLSDSLDTVSGTLDVDAFQGIQLDVYCEIWEELGSVVSTQAQADGGNFTCEFAGYWDIQPGETIAISYEEPDGDWVTTIADWPWMRVNLSYDQVGGNYHADQKLTIAVTDAIDAEKASAAVASEWSGGWEGEGFETEEGDWWPTTPDILPGDKVHIVSDNGFTHTLEVGMIDAIVDTAKDEVSGTIIAPPTFTDPMTVACHPWGAWESGIDAPVKESVASPNGSMAFLCEWDPSTEWDMQPGQEIAVMYIEPDGDRVIDVFEEPIPHLRVEKQGFGELTQGGNAHYRIKLWNEGSAPAENVVLTDVMEGLTYLEDTSGIPYASLSSGTITWEMGTLEAGQSIQFDLFAQVTTSETVTNTVSVTTSTATDQGDPWEKTATWVNAVIPNDTYLHVNKHALTDNPAPDQDIIFILEICNDGGTSSSQITLSDDLDPALSLVNWWSYESGWTEQSSNSGNLTLTRPTIASGACSSVKLRAHVASTAAQGSPLANTAQIDVTNDLSPDDNEAFWEGEVDQPLKNVRIDKGWRLGQLVPGGVIHYNLHYENTGNVPVGSLVLTDTFPTNTTFVGAWIHDPWGSTPFIPDSLIDNWAEWHIPELLNGASVEIEVALAIDSVAVPGTALVNTAEISLLPDEVSHIDNASKWTEVIYPALPNLRIHKWHEWREDWQLLYKIQFENIGSEPVGDILVTDVLPVDTEWNGWQSVEINPERLVDWEYVDGTFHWNFSKLLPGESGWIMFRANLTEPGTLMREYTNTVEITLPDGDPNPADNFAATVAFSGSDVQSVAFWLDPKGHSSMWGEALPDSMITVITPHKTFSASADPECDGCWQIADVGALAPGDEVTISTDQELQLVEVTIPDPFSAAVDYISDEVSGQVGGWYERPVEIHGEWPSGFREVISDSSGNYSASFPDIPDDGSGYMRIVDMVNYAEVSYHLPFPTSDLFLEVNYSHDGVEGYYEPGYTVGLTITDHLDIVKATAQLETQEIPWWEPGETGFSTHLGSPWDPAVPDIVPGDWVYAEMDNGQMAEVQVGEINGTLNFNYDTIDGYVFLKGVTETLQGRCSVWEEGGPTIEFEVESDNGLYSCDLAAQGWDLQRDHHVAVQYQDPKGHWVINVFHEEWQIYLPLMLRYN